VCSVSTQINRRKKRQLYKRRSAPAVSVRYSPLRSRSHYLQPHPPEEQWLTHPFAVFRSMPCALQQARESGSTNHSPPVSLPFRSPSLRSISTLVTVVPKYSAASAMVRQFSIDMISSPAR